MPSSVVCWLVYLLNELSLCGVDGAVVMELCRHMNDASVTQVIAQRPVHPGQLLLCLHLRHAQQIG
jgi:hypothetical protein